MNFIGGKVVYTAAAFRQFRFEYCLKVIVKVLDIRNRFTFGFENDIFWQIFEKIGFRNSLTLQEPRNLSEKSNKKLYLPNESRVKINSELKIGDFAGVSFLPSVAYNSAYFHDLYNIHRVPFNENKNGLAFFNFVLQYEIKSLLFQAGVFDISSAGNSPEKLTALENPYFVLRYPGMNFKGSVKWKL
jgi:hypothetical protein